jgi:heme/copper-type cytochrome/quinol oxidase subunit 4
MGEATRTDVTIPEAVTTYRYVRIALVALVVFLAASIVCTAVQAKHWQTSISAYFYTSSHMVFVASLCAVGACLIVYQGRTTTEDALLNFSGLLAFVVGLVPTGREPLRGPGLPCDFDTALFAKNSMWALLSASVITGVAVVIMNRLSPAPERRRAPFPSTVTVPSRLQSLFRLAGRIGKPLEYVLPWVLLAALALGAAFFIFKRDWFVDNAHGRAAPIMFGGIILVVVHYACYAALRPQKKRWFVMLYAILAVAMVATVVLAFYWHVFSTGDDRPSHGIIIVEALVILEFALFWIIQSVDLWWVEKETYWIGSLSDLFDELGNGPVAPENR